MQARSQIEKALVIGDPDFGLLARCALVHWRELVNVGDNGRHLPDFIVEHAIKCWLEFGADYLDTLARERCGGLLGRLCNG